MQTLPSFEELRKGVVSRSVPLQPKTTSVIAAVNVSSRLRVCAYCRISTNHEDQQSSIKAQTQHFATLLAAHPEWENAGLYVDIASGTKKEKRPELQRMLTDCRAGRISLILTKSISRFARNTSDLLEMVRTLTGMGVDLIFEREHIDTRSMGTEFLLSILASLAEDESHSISSNCRWGIQKRFMDGSYRAVNAPYGYDIVDGGLVVNEVEAKIVQSIFGDYLAGMNASAIARKLNEAAIPTKRKGMHQRGKVPVRGQWDASAIKRVLRNENYVGSVLLQKTTKDANFKVVKNTGQLPMYRIIDHHEPIIEETVFEAVQAKLNANKPVQHIKTKHPFCKRIICGICGHKMWREQNAAGNVYWFCPKHRRGDERCPQCNVKETTLMENLDDIIRSLRDAELPILDYIASLRSHDDAERTSLEEKLAQINVEMAEIGSAVTAENITRRNQLSQERWQITLQIDRAKSQKERQTEELLKIIKSSSSVLCVEALVETIIIEQEHIRVCFHGGFSMERVIRPRKLGSSTKAKQMNIPQGA